MNAMASSCDRRTAALSVTNGGTLSMIVGIDLGTTNSLIGVYRDQGSVLFPNSLGSVLTPSAISLDEDGAVLVGQAARDRLVTHPGRSVATFKRWMGSPRETTLGARKFRPEELSALVLRSLIMDAEAALGSKVVEAVISVPAYFSDAQRKATRTAGTLAGIKVERLINEPTAAALAYGLQKRTGSGKFLVFDLGGGTFDVSIIELFEGVVEVHASAGDNFLGGEDFLELLVSACAKDLGLDLAVLTPGELAQLRQRLERAKREISPARPARVVFTAAGTAQTWTCDEDRFAVLAEPLVQRMRAPLERAVRDAKLDPSSLDEIVMVGGASRMPVAARLVAGMFGRLPLRHVNPDEAIALGAAVAAGMKARDARLDEVILTDVCPYTLGTEVAKRNPDGTPRFGFYHPIIQRNSAVPISREDTFWPTTDDQTEMSVDVYQGEHPMVAKNIKLGEISVPLPKVKDRAQKGVTVRFTYDINGILQVNVKVDTTGEQRELVLQQNPGLLTNEEIKARLAALADIKVHPREKQENLALIARAERLYEEYLDARDSLQSYILTFRAVLDSQDDRAVARSRRELIEALDAVERA